MWLAPRYEDEDRKLSNLDYLLTNDQLLVEDVHVHTQYNHIERGKKQDTSIG